jgi:cysteine-rich repeat protein
VCILGLLAGCLQESSSTCGSGGVCPPGRVCANTGDDRICILVTCGNGRLDPGEVCDDTNTRSGDGCPADCTAPCGDGVLDPGEVCDDGNSNDGDGCAADCQLVDGVYLVSPPVVTFTAIEGDVLPAAATVSVRLLYRGDNVVVGYPPDVLQPSWLSFTAGASTATTVELQLQVSDTTIVGSRSTIVRFALMHENSTGLERFDLPVSYEVERSDLAVTASPGALAFTSTVGDVAVPPQTVEVSFNGGSAMLVASPPWASVSPPSVQETSPARFAVTINDTSFAAGTVLTDELVFVTTRRLLERRIRMMIRYQVTAPLPIMLEPSPSALTFMAFSGRAIPLPQPVAVEFSGASVDVVSAPPWVTVVGPPLPTTSPASFSIAVNTTAFAGGTVQSGNVVFRTMRGAEQETAAVYLEYHVRTGPEVQFVAPYVGIAGGEGMLRVRGHGFQSMPGPVTIGVGDLEINQVIPDSDTQITVSYPPLPSGHYVVTFNPRAGNLTSAELVIVAPSALSYQAIDAPSLRERLVYDAERQAIYAANRVDQQIERFVYIGGTWSVLPPRVIPLLNDIALAPNGRSLIAVSGDAIHEIPLTNNLFAPVRRADNPDPFCGGFLDHAGASNDGKFFVVSKLAGCSGSSSAYLYDMRTHLLSPTTSLYEGLAAASADGSRIYAGSNGLSPAPRVEIFNSLSDTISTSNVNVNLYAISVSSDASRVVLQNHLVYSRALTLLGNVPAHGPALVSRDSSRVFIYTEDPSPRLEIYDLSGPLQAGALFPLLKTVVIPDAANGPGSVHPVAMTSSLDDSVVFVSGDSKLLIVPVN